MKPSVQIDLIALDEHSGDHKFDTTPWHKLDNKEEDLFTTCHVQKPLREFAQIEHLKVFFKFQNCASFSAG